MAHGGAAALAAILAASAAAAQEPAYPRLTGLTYGRFQLESVYRSSNGRREVDQFLTRSTLLTALELDPRWAIRSSLKLEPVERVARDRVFGGHGLWLEELYVDYEDDDVGLFAGKFNATFGFAFDHAPIMFGRRIVQEYETADRIGGGGKLKWHDAAGGRHALVASTFFLDSTVTSQSLFTRPDFGAPTTFRPGRVRPEDGGLSNTRSLESFTVAMTGQGVGGPLDLSYTVGWRHQRAGATEAHDEDGLAAGARWTWRLDEGTYLRPLVEYAHFRRFAGGDGEVRFLTAAATLSHGGWLATLTASGRVGEGRTDHLLAATGGYAWPGGIAVEVGWKTERIRDIESQAAGMLVRWRRTF
ncbi:MAG: hypothetical protein AB7P02_16660 [Alphaproteobacteria bacterium]